MTAVKTGFIVSHGGNLIRILHTSAAEHHRMECTSKDQTTEEFNMESVYVIYIQSNKKRQLVKLPENEIS